MFERSARRRRGRRFTAWLRTRRGSVTIDGYNGFWFGFIRNDVHGSVSLNNNMLLDEDGNEYVTNTIYGSLNCSGNSPHRR
jgi:hypothetical protein